MKKIICLLIFINLLLLCSCGKSMEIKYIDSKEIFNQTEETYLIYFYKNDCTGCESTKEIVENYLNESSNKKRAYQIYGVDVSSTTIFRSYKGQNGQGTDNNFYVDYVTSYEDLYIGAVPSIVKIDKNKQAMYVSQGYTNISNYLQGLLKPYSVTFDADGGTMPEEYEKEFYEVNEYVLPTPTKNEYVFVGWEENGQIVKKVSTKNYNLKAKWIEYSAYTYIKDEEILSKSEDKYLVYFMKDGCTFCERIKSSILAYLYLTSLEQYKDAMKLYIVNLHVEGENSSVILKSYTGNNGQGSSGDNYVNGAKSWNELRIPATPTLIMVETVNGVKEPSFLEVGSTVIKQALDNALVGNDSKFTVEYNIGYETTEKITSITYYTWQNVYLPLPSRDGFVFLGWEKDGEIIKTVIPNDCKLTARWMSEKEYGYIEDKDIFNQNEDQYLVYFMKDGCAYCEKIKETVIDYVYKSNSSLYNKSTKLYIVNLNHNGYKSVILTKYTETDGQGVDKDNWVDGVTKWDEIKVPGTPTIIMVKIVDGIKTAEYLNTGSTNVSNVLASNLKKSDENIDENETYTITFNDEMGNVIKNKTFKAADPVFLPILEKEGYLFLGWFDGETKITTVGNKNYNLQSKWQKMYTINYDVNGGVMPQNYDKYFLNNNIELPVPTKENYLFIGWEENDQIIDSLSSKNYNLKAKWIEYFNIDYIEDKNIFNQSESNYLVYFMKDDSTTCDQVKDQILVYLYRMNNLSNYKKLYVVNLKLSGMSSSKISRSYVGYEGQGTDGSFLVNGVTKYEDLYISITPCIIEINENNGTKQATYIESNPDNIKKAINNYQLNNLDKYTITYDYQYDNTTKKQFMYTWQTTYLIEPLRDNYVFISWQLNDSDVETIKANDTTLSAKWISKIDCNYIKDEEIFNQQPSKYLILFIKENSPYCKIIKQSLIDYILKTKENENIEMIYVCDLTDGGTKSVIYRNYDGDSANADGRQLVTGITKWDEFYIAYFPTLIEIEEINGVKEANYITTGSSPVKKLLTEYLNK